VVGAVLCNVFLAADKAKSRKNVELRPVFSQHRPELVQSTTAVLSCFTLRITQCGCACVCDRESEIKSDIAMICFDAFVLACDYKGSRGIIIWQFCSSTFH